MTCGPYCLHVGGWRFCFFAFLEKRHSFENVLHLLLGYPRGSITSALCPRETPRKGAEPGALGRRWGRTGEQCPTPPHPRRHAFSPSCAWQGCSESGVPGHLCPHRVPFPQRPEASWMIGSRAGLQREHVDCRCP